MLNNRTIAVVVPAYNEETQIRLVIETMPDFVDRIIVVNDCSTDKTSEVVRDCISKSAEDTIRISNVLNEVKPDRYNKASIVVQQLQQEEINRFTPSEVVNTSEETERVILIEQQRNPRNHFHHFHFTLLAHIINGFDFHFSNSTKRNI